MIKSMTGYGQAREVIGAREIHVEVRSVNSRFLEHSIRTARSFSYLEDPLRRLLKSKISRGKTELSVTITLADGKHADIMVNEEIARGYVTAIQLANANAIAQGKEDFVLDATLTWKDLLHLPDLFRVEKVREDEEEILRDVLAVADKALDSLVAMRSVEGESLRTDILAHLEVLASLLTRVEENAPIVNEKYFARLQSRIEELLESATIDPQRILTEAAIFAEKTAVDEETVRLHSHITQMHILLKESDPVGRKLDFLVQEMNRETNTIGSKIQDVTITEIVVAMKSEIEKIREQIQNIE